MPLTLSLAAIAGDGGCTPDWDHAFAEAGQFNAPVRSMCAFNDGRGTRLFAGGDFTAIHSGQDQAGTGTIDVGRIVAWDGLEWVPVGAGFNGIVWDLAVFDDGSGPALYAGGAFTEADGQPAMHIARWDGSSWSPVGDGVNDTVYTLAVYDDGSGPSLYAGGTFTSAAGQPAARIAQWDGESWSPLLGGVSGSATPRVDALAVFDDNSGNGPALYVGGTFTTANGQIVNRIARWDGTAFSSLSGGLSGAARAFHVMQDGTDEVLIVAGSFSFTQSGLEVNFITQWDGSDWSALGLGFNNSSRAVTSYEEGDGLRLFVGGQFFLADGEFAQSIARWNGTEWTPLGLGMNDTVWSLATYDDGTGEALYVGGSFTTADGQPTAYLARWRGCIDPDPGDPADLNDDGAVNVLDLLVLLSNWGDCGGGSDCAADLNEDETVNVLDLLVLLSAWG